VSVLQAARQAGIYIPSLCELEELPATASCRLCLVDIKGRPSFIPACATRAEDGMEIVTSSDELERLRLDILEMILSEHPYFCLLCREKATCDDLKVTMRRLLSREAVSSVRKMVSVTCSELPLISI